MKIQLKEVKSYKGSRDSLDVHFNARAAELKEMTRLLDTTQMSDGELAMLASKFYEIKLSPEDALRLAASRLKSEDLVIKKIKTVIKSQIDGRELELEASIYCKSDAEIQQDCVYTETELQELIQSGVIVVKDFSEWSLQGIDFQDYDQELTRFSPIIDVSLQNLGIFADTIMHDVRESLKPERVSLDSERMASKVREELKECRDFVDEIRGSAAQRYHEARAQVAFCDKLVTRLEFMGYGELGEKITEEIYPSSPERYGVTPSSR
ncbi:MAG: hypothetical protein K2J20_02835 [Bacilli bacterium]|nr:hypothetical protein [Bacilli bacterium]